MTARSFVRELFEIPDHVRKGDFVLKLSEGVARAKETAESYVVTPGILDAFDTALGLVHQSLDDGRSRASYVHGSFGSGKSHFMAILSLLLSNSDEAWRITQFHGLREKHPWVKAKHVLQLRFHMVGQPTLEAAIFGEYVRWVKANKPEATIPPLFADEALFEDARRLLDKVGDEAFFASMNEGSETAGAGWGKVAEAGRWTHVRFDAAASATDPNERADLFSALAKSHFRAFAEQKSSFVDIDSGLAILARHAKSLGFDVVVLFLDELVLWLASGASNASWCHTEVQKTAKLVEAQDASREIAIVSFIARQRDLADLVGDDLAGAENKRLRESLDWFKGRFDRIPLEDTNLPEIVRVRILHPKDDAAKKQLDESFTTLQRDAKAAWSTLVGQEDAEAFRKLYPFSPALVETLVGLSNTLQRNRTAIRLLMEILVDHISDLQIGDVVGVGDLFDVLAGGDDTADGVMKAHFDAAKQLYKHQLLPIIQETNGTGSAAKCQRLRPDHRPSLGCSGCPEKSCRTDNRLVKTLLIAALVPQVKVLKDLTASKLVQLNHGTLRAPIPGTEAGLVVQKLKLWGSRLGQIHIGNQNDPTVTIDLGGVDLEPILQQAREADNMGARQRIVRDVLFENLALDPKGDWGQDDVLKDWRGTDRKGHVRFGNVRRLGDVLRCPEGDDWRLILDYPFDDPNFGPNDDLEVVDAVREEGVGTWTLVLLPSFFSKSMNDLLGEIAILDHILESTTSKRASVQHLRVEQQPNALLGLENLRSQKRARLQGALLQAYGFVKETEHDIDPSQSLPTHAHVHVLKPSITVQLPLGATLTVLREEGIGRLLDKRYPRHPHLRKITKAIAQRVLELFSQLMDMPDHRLPADNKDDIEKMRDTLGALGIVSVTENAILLVEDRTLQLLERKRQQKSINHPTVGEMRAWLDEDRTMGLQHEAVDLVVRTYARWSARSLMRHGKAYEPTFNTAIPDDVALEKPDLPAATEWEAALDLAGHAFGLALAGRALHAENVRRFESELNVKLKLIAASAAALPGALQTRLTELGMSGGDRLKTAQNAAALCALLEGKSGLEQVRTLAAFHAETSPKAVGRSLATGPGTVHALTDKLIFAAFTRLQRDANGKDLLDQLSRVFAQDEIHESLAARLRSLAEAAGDILGGSAKPPATATATTTKPIAVLTITRGTLTESLGKINAQIKEALEKDSGDLIVTVQRKERR